MQQTLSFLITFASQYCEFGFIGDVHEWTTKLRIPITYRGVIGYRFPVNNPVAAWGYWYRGYCYMRETAVNSHGKYNVRGKVSLLSSLSLSGEWTSNLYRTNEWISISWSPPDTDFEILASWWQPSPDERNLGLLLYWVIHVSTCNELAVELDGRAPPSFLSWIFDAFTNVTAIQ